MIGRCGRRVHRLLLLVAVASLLVVAPVSTSAASDVSEELAITKQAYDLLVANLSAPPDTVALLTNASVEAQRALGGQIALPPLDGDAAAQWGIFESSVRDLAARSDANLAAGNLRSRLIGSMVRTIGDGHTFSLTKQESDARKAVNAGDTSIANYGYNIVTYNNDYYIATLIPGGNMAVAGGRVGDHLLVIDDQTVTRATYSGLIATQAEGGAHTFTVLHRNETEPVRLTVTINRYTRPPLAFRVLYGHVGYIQVFTFSYRNLVDRLDEALAALHAQGVDSLILDLRDNPGGMDTLAQRFLGRFLPTGTIVGTDEGRIYARQSPQSSLKAQKFAQGDDHDPDMLPIVALVNSRSASWGEMASLALHEFRDASLIGTKTRGLLGNDVVYPLRDGTSIGITVGIYTSAQGQALNKIGITPDVAVTNPTPEDIINGRDAQLDAAVMNANAKVYTRTFGPLLAA